MTKRQERGAAREELVIGAATELIAERGLANIRVTDVAKRANMSPGHVTYYFPSKTELLMRAIRRSEEAFTDQLERSLRRIKDPWRRLTRLIELSAADGPGDQGWVLWFEVWSNASTDRDVAQLHEELDRRSKALLTDVIVYGRDLGVFHTSDPDTAAWLLAAVIDGLSIQLALGASDLDREAVLSLCMQQAEALLGPRPKPARSRKA